MKKYFFVLAGAWIFILSPLGWAADFVESGEPVSKMEEMVVTAGRVKEKKKEITVNLTVIDAQEIKLSPARNLGDLLAEKAIGYVQKYPGSLTAIGLRGFKTETHGNDLLGHVLILLNGRRAGTGNVAQISTKNIERIEIIRGPGAVQYGSAAVGGVINVITRQGKGAPHLFVQGTLGSFGFEEAGAGLSGKNERLDVSGSVTTSTADDYDTTTGQTYFNTGYDRKDCYSLNIGYELIPGNRIGAIFNGYKVEHQGTPNYLNVNDLDDYTNKKNQSVDVIYDGGSMNLPLTWKVRFFDGTDEDESFYPSASDPDFIVTGWPYDNDDFYKNKTDYKGSQAQISMEFSHFLVTGGVDWSNYENEMIWGSPEEYEYDDIAGFVLAKGKFLEDRVILSGGFRYDSYEIEMHDSSFAPVEDESFIPQLGLAWLPKEHLKFRLNYGEAFVMPVASSMFGNPVSYDGGFTTYAKNPNLKPEESQTYEAGLDVTYETFNGSLTWFYTDFEEMIQTVTKPGNILIPENIGNAVVAGFEGEISLDIGYLLNWTFEVKPYLNVVYLTEYKDKDADEDLKYRSEMNASYGIRISDHDGFSGNINFAYTGKQKLDDFEYNSINGLWSDPPIIDWGGFTVANMSLSKKVIDVGKWGGVTLKGDIQNLFDTDYAHVKGYPMPGRRFFVSLRYDY